MPNSDDIDSDFYWGSASVDLTQHDLPRLKAEYIVQSLPHTGSVLEVGCGGGRILNTIAASRPQLSLQGVDIRPLRSPPERFQFTQVDAGAPDLPFPSELFDAVVVCDVLEHLPDPSAQLAATRRVMRPGGSLICFVPLERNPWSVHRLYRALLGTDLYFETKDHRHAFSERDVDRIVSTHFVIEHRAYVYHLLGQFMDATLYAALRVPALRRRYSAENPYYRDDAPEQSHGALGALMKLGNTIAYYESRRLRNVRILSGGMLFRAVAARTR